MLFILDRKSKQSRLVIWRKSLMYGRFYRTIFTFIRFISYSMYRPCECCLVSLTCDTPLQSSSVVMGPATCIKAFFKITTRRGYHWRSQHCKKRAIFVLQANLHFLLLQALVLFSSVKQVIDFNMYFNTINIIFDIF